MFQSGWVSSSWVARCPDRHRIFDSKPCSGGWEPVNLQDARPLELALTGKVFQVDACQDRRYVCLKSRLSPCWTNCAGYAVVSQESERGGRAVASGAWPGERYCFARMNSAGLKISVDKFWTVALHGYLTPPRAPILPRLPHKKVRSIGKFRHFRATWRAQKYGVHNPCRGVPQADEAHQNTEAAAGPLQRSAGTYAWSDAGAERRLSGQDSDESSDAQGLGASCGSGRSKEPRKPRQRAEMVCHVVQRVRI